MNYKGMNLGVAEPISLRDRVNRKQDNQELQAEIDATEAKRIEEENAQLAKRIPFEKDARFSQELITPLPVTEEELENNEAAQKLVGNMVKEAGDRFVKDNPEYYVCMDNFKTIAGYLYAQGVTNPTKEAFQAAYDILHRDGRMIEKPLEEQQGHIAVDPATNVKRVYSDKEIERMDSETYARAFGLKPTRKWGR